MNSENVKKVFSNNLNYYMELHDINNRELSNIIGVSESTVGKWLLQKSIPRMGVIELLANYFHIEKSDLIEPAKEQEEDEILTYRYIESPVAAGRPVLVEGQNYQTISISSRLLGKHRGNKNIIIMKVGGESMNKILPNGSFIGILPYTTSFDIQDGDIVVFNDEDYNYSVKRYYKIENNIIFKPESTYPTYTDIIYNLDEKTVEIIGKVIMYNVIL